MHLIQAALIASVLYNVGMGATINASDNAPSWLLFKALPVFVGLLALVALLKG